MRTAIEGARALLFSATALTGSAAVLLSASPASAQDQQQTETPTAPSSEVQAPPEPENAPMTEIVVTGSLIRNPNLVQSNPVNVTTSDEIALKQSNTAEEVLREIPGIVSNIGSGVNNGNNGSAYVDLRGLGSNRNIVLLDGNRLPVSSLTTAAGASSVDLNSIPLALISRIDSLTGAAVTTYGADAITGVINFITRKDFSGVEATASQQLTERGDGSYFRADLTLGANFADGRGNAVVSLGYQNSDPVYQGDRDFSVFQLSSYSGGANGSGLATIPSRFTGTRPIDPETGQPSVDPAVPNGGVRQLQVATGTAVAPYFFFNFNPYNIFQTPFKRYNIFAQGNYEITDNIEVYARGLFSKNKVTTIVAPSGSFGDQVTINLNNPFLPATLRNQFCAFNIAPVDPVTGTQLTYQPRFTPAECAAAAAATGASDPNYRTVTTALNRRAVEVGSRTDEYTTTIFDYRMGVRGKLTDTVNWDVNGSYGESQLDQLRLNYTLQSRFRQGTLVDGTLANPVCEDSSNGCVPVNLFGEGGSISPAAASFLSADSTITTKTSLAQARAIVNGDFGFSLPSASQPIGFAVGAEYRRYHAEQLPDVLAQTPGEVGGAGGARLKFAGSYDVYEAYGELIAPLVEDKPFFESLTIEGGARYSSYKVQGGASHETFTYKVGGSWEPGGGLKLRGNYSRAVRAPNLYELFLPNNTVLTNLAVDPCAGAAPTTNANLRAVCIAQGAPPGTIGSITNPAAAQANITTAGNVNLKPETATTYTFGAVFQPTFLPRFSISADYYHIKVVDVIGAALPGDLINACFGNITASSATNPDCTVIRRDPLTGGLDGSAATTPGLFGPLNNLGVLLTDGIDVIANYNTDLGFAKWAVNFVGNWTSRSKFQATPSSIFRECVGFYSVNCSFTGSLQPRYQWSLRNTFTIHAVDLSLLWRHVSSFRQEPDDVNNSGPAFEGTLGPDTGALDGTHVNFGRIPAYDIFDFTTRFKVNDRFTFTASVQNLFDRQPPIVGNTIGSTTFNSGNTYPATYDALGRRYAVGVKLDF